ncbi:class I SAM-dependent methyltransferase [bacterium]|nr:class I SAM-dependent methyltransferase [bacterium]
MIKLARQIAEKERANIKFYAMDVCSLKFKSSSFDNILFSFNGFEQIPKEKNRIKAVKEMYRVLKPEGVLILTTQSILNPSNFVESIKQYFSLKREHKNIEFGDSIFFSEGSEVYIHFSNPLKIKELMKKTDLILSILTLKKA